MKKTKRLVMLALALVLTFAMATTTTFAWFTMNNVVTVSGISGTARADEGLLISQDGETYLTYVNLSTNLNLIPVTPGTNATLAAGGTATAPTIKDGETAGTLLSAIKFFNAEGQSQTPTEGNPTAYYQQTFHFRSDVEMIVKMTKITVNTTPATGADIRNVTAPYAIAADAYGTHGAYAKDAPIYTDLLKAIRIALFNDDGELIAVYHLVDAQEEEGVAQNFDGVTGGYNMAGYLYKTILNEDPISSSGIDGTISLGITGTGGDTEIDVVADYQAGITLEVVTGGVTPRYEGTITVVIWIEGTDGDCINSVINDALTIDLAFTGTQVTEAPEELEDD